MLNVLGVHNYLTLCSVLFCASNPIFFYLGIPRKYIVTWCFLGQIILLFWHLINTLEAYNLSQSHWVAESIQWWVYYSFVSHQLLCSKHSCEWILIWQSISFAAFSRITSRWTSLRVHVLFLLRLNAHHRQLIIEALQNFLSNMKYLGSTQKVPEKCGKLGAWFIWLSHEVSLSHAKFLISDWSGTNRDVFF